jgi:hypothetical protein
VTRVIVAAVLLAAASQTPSLQPQPGNASPSSPDPAAATFSTEQGLLLVAVKPDKVADYEAVIVALQEVLSRAADEDVRAMAAGWRVYKASELDAKSNAIYVHVLQPALAGVDYRPSLWLDKLLEGAPPELLAKYRDSFAIGPTKLPLVEFAHMAVAPVPKNTSPEGPTNGSPEGFTWVRRESS